MKKITITIAIALLSTIVATAENQRVAVFDPAGNAEQYINEITREVISSVIVNTGRYTVLERAEINRVLDENRFQMSGLVDDAQVIEMGRLMGANLTFVTNLTRMGTGNFFISARLIDVATGRIEKQQTAQTSRREEDLVIVVRRTAEEMFGNLASTPISRIEGSPRLVLDRRTVYQGGRKLNTPEVLDLMGGTDAFRLFERGVSRNRTANIFLYPAGGIVLVCGTMSIISNGTHRFGDDGLIAMTAGVGVLIGIPGLIFRANGKKDVRNAVSTYNQSINRADNTNIELNFGITQNGMGLVLNF